VQVAVVPAKLLSMAKTRLGPLLGDAERAAIAHAMFRDVLAALRGATAIDRVLVVTADDRLAASGRAGGAAIVDEGVPRGLNAAVTLGTDTAVRLGATAVAVVLSDVPFLRPGDVDELLARAPAAGIALVPSKEGTGTNAIVCRPGAVVPPRFGGRSLERHVAAAERRRVACVIWRNTRIGFDVDVPADLATFARRASATATYRELTRLGDRRRALGGSDAAGERRFHGRG
jgi:2-phospho-L-lactate guanylyltransferase